MKIMKIFKNLILGIVLGQATALCAVQPRQMRSQLWISLIPERIATPLSISAQSRTNIFPSTGEKNNVPFLVDEDGDLEIFLKSCRQIKVFSENGNQIRKIDLTSLKLSEDPLQVRASMGNFYIKEGKNKSIDEVKEIDSKGDIRILPLPKKIFHSNLRFERDRIYIDEGGKDPILFKGKDWVHGAWGSELSQNEEYQFLPDGSASIGGGKYLVRQGYFKHWKNKSKINLDFISCSSPENLFDFNFEGQDTQGNFYVYAKCGIQRSKFSQEWLIKFNGRWNATAVAPLLNGVTWPELWITPEGLVLQLVVKTDGRVEVYKWL